MAEKQRSRTLDYLVYLLVRVFVCVIQALPYEQACQVARFFGWVAYKLNKRHLIVALENLQKSFPGQYTDEELDVLVWRVYVHFCTMLIEIMHMPRRYHLRNHKRFITLRHPEQTVGALLSGRPVLIVTGHFGNWEMAGYALGLFGFHTHAIARRLDNRRLDAFLRRFRQRTGQTVLDKRGDFERIEALLAGGGVLATLADQDAGQ